MARKSRRNNNIIEKKQEMMTPEIITGPQLETGVYARLSVEKDNEETIQTQIEMLHQYVEEHGECGPQEIELFIIKNAPARVNYPEALGLRHLAFKVESVDDTVKELNGKGIETEPVRLDDYTGKKMTFFHDPDGLPLEIHE